MRTTGVPANQVHLALGVEHLRKAVAFAGRGKARFFDDEDPLLFIAVEAELRKGFESINRLGNSFWQANPQLRRHRIGELREQLTHEYSDVDRDTVWTIVTREVPPILRKLERPKMPKED
ncbi:MAG: HepT-like ribonuclease domain-containing protein [Thermoplasmata archaeon]